MPYKHKPLKKKYYRIGEVANHFGVFASRIRYYSDMFDMQFKRTRRGVRLYETHHISKLEKIIYLKEVAKFTIEGIRQWLQSWAKRLEVQHG